ncbi:MazG-like family protein [Pseudophaeobacter flagellatus]|uniref:MazG-like family protein n=1 Tax=Pseudophaeobacter flagellatus TaxID=2899119 RepID=UPI001E37E4B8|nr:MazG-like family protein [Pseudophaeobacter flagellatus]MCD9147799.1 MazG-like family protein [Pseudophaeobacter flagellatus]
MKIDFSNLRAANISRQAEWPGNDKADLGFRALEVADEAGELMGALKKLARAQRGIAGNTLSMQDVADEMGDTVIALDLLAIEMDFHFRVWADNDWAHQAGPPTPVEELALMLDAAVGNLSGFVADRLQEDRGEVRADSTDQKIRKHAGRTAFWVMCLADALGVDLETAITTKFNKTSEKYGMATRL